MLEFIASVTGMKNLVDVLDQTFAKMSNMLTVLCRVKRLDLFCATYSRPPTLTCECIIFFGLTLRNFGAGLAQYLIEHRATERDKRLTVEWKYCGCKTE